MTYRARSVRPLIHRSWARRWGRPSILARARAQVDLWPYAALLFLILWGLLEGILLLHRTRVIELAYQDNRAWVEYRQALDQRNVLQERVAETADRASWAGDLEALQPVDQAEEWASPIFLPDRNRAEAEATGGP